MRLTEVRAGIIVLCNMFIGMLERAILETLAYSDIFEYPLSLNELHRYLPMRAETDQVFGALHSLDGLLGEQDGFYFLAGREKIVGIRMQREVHSQKLMLHALKYGRMLGALPFIRMVALTGSLAVMNSARDSDFDYMLVAAPNRVWTARAFALLLNRVTRLFGDTLCPNLIVSENALTWSTHDLYSARELCQMIPITGVDVYRKLMRANKWTNDFLPNAGKKTSEVFKTSEVWKLSELPLRGRLGDRIEHWEMNRKIARFSMQTGFGEETVFNADVCQGNFDHHKKWTQEMFENKLSALAAISSSESVGEQSPGTAIGAYRL